MLGQLPCRPARHARLVELADQTLEMNLMSCQASESTWAVAWVSGADVRRVPQMLEEWRLASLRNVGAQATAMVGMDVPGATPQPGTGRWKVRGHRPDRSQVVQELAMFSHGTTVFQVTALSSEEHPAASEQFFASLRLQPTP